jgi:hypothetical protein
MSAVLPVPPTAETPRTRTTASRTQRSSRAMSSLRPVNFSSLLVSWTREVFQEDL